MKPKLIGKGTYGCVYYPSLKCKSKSKKNIYNNRVSKVMTQKDAKDELSEYENLKIPGLEKYAIIGPVSCDPVYDNVLNESLKECNNNKIKDLYEFDLFFNKNSLKLLLLENGGINLYDYMNNIFNNQDYEDQKIFLTSIINLFKGIKFFIDNNIIHRDIKILNIVYNIQTGESKFIDFGLAINRNKLLENCKKNKESLAVSHSYFPPENSCTNLSKYINSEKCKKYRINFKNHDEFIKKTSIAFDIYCLSFALIDLITLLIQKGGTKFSYFAIDCMILFKKYTKKNIIERDISIENLLNNYRELLKKHNLYSLKNPNPKTVNIQKFKSIIKNSYEKELNKKKCTKDKPIYNNITNRCLKLCKNGYERNQLFKCVKVINSKNKSKKSRCPNGTRRDKKTLKCVNISSINKTYKKTYKKTRCPNGTRRNKKTGLCESMLN